MEDPQHAKETKTAEELAAMIREDPSKMDGCPECGALVPRGGIEFPHILLKSRNFSNDDFSVYP
jgi:hypothetical protein